MLLLLHLEVVWLLVLGRLLLMEVLLLLLLSLIILVVIIEGGLRGGRGGGLINVLLVETLLVWVRIVSILRLLVC